MPPREFTLSIPHICDEIVSHLSSKDIFNCITVSREFYQIFSPYVWRRIVINGPDLYSSLRDVVRASDGNALVKNQHRVQVLASNQDELWNLFVERIDSLSETSAGSADVPISRYNLCAPFTNLVDLQAAPFTLEDRVSRTNPDFVKQVYGLVEHLPCLHTLCLGEFYSSDNMHVPMLAKIIRGHRSLKVLTVLVDVFLLSLYRKLLWACWNLERLQVTARFYSIDRPDMAEESRLSAEEEQELDRWLAENRPEVCAAAMEDSIQDDNDDTKTPFRLKEFTLNSDPSNGELGVTSPFLRRCRWLKQLRPPHMDAEDFLSVSGNEVRTVWRDLEHLDLRNLNRNWEVVSLSAIAMLFCLGNELRSLTLAPNQNVYSGTAMSAQRLSLVLLWHVNSLVHLRLEGCSQFTGADLQSVLSSCPNLRSLEALTAITNEGQPANVGIEDPILQSCDVETADDWVCHGLQRLRIRIRNGDMSTAEYRQERAGIPREIFCRIQRLEKLRDLQLCLVKPTWEDSGLPEDSEEVPAWESSVEMCGTQNLNDALEAFNSLKDLERVWLRDLKDYVKLDLTKDKMEWARLKRALFS
ncbi:hypothetical protein BGZ82_011306 [Podila clonocystis]|nr:hypothetical protein BGZ82_011306 [Podila clonocystis]